MGCEKVSDVQQCAVACWLQHTQQSRPAATQVLFSNLILDIGTAGATLAVEGGGSHGEGVPGGGGGERGVVCDPWCRDVSAIVWAIGAVAVALFNTGRYGHYVLLLQLHRSKDLRRDSMPDLRIRHLAR